MSAEVVWWRISGGKAHRRRADLKPWDAPTLCGIIDLGHVDVPLSQVAPEDLCKRCQKAAAR